MHIIVRACGERTEKRCIALAKKQGRVHVIRAHPFGESIRQTYELAIKLGQDWLPVVDADVLLYPDTLKKAVTKLRASKKNIFCLDGKTTDKIMMQKRRAGIHIYKTALLPLAMQYIDSGKTKPESHVRKMMEKRHGYKTTVGSIVFGVHDYEQYYADIWRKAVAQSHKLAGMIKRGRMRQKWAVAAKRDNDYKVVLAAHDYGASIKGKIIIDSRIDYGAARALKKINIQEKKPL